MKKYRVHEPAEGWCTPAVGRVVHTSCKKGGVYAMTSAPRHVNFIGDVNRHTHG